MSDDVITDTDDHRADDPGPAPGESQKERVDRELIELLNELRVALPGVQVLFAFLLTVPFATGFEELTRLQRGVYFATFLTVAGTSALLMAPTSYHRLRFREGNKEQMLRTANKLAIAGIAMLAFAIGASVFFVSDVLYGSASAAIVAAGVSGWLAFWWFALPLSRKIRDPSSGDGSV